MTPDYPHSFWRPPNTPRYGDLTPRRSPEIPPERHIYTLYWCRRSVMIKSGAYVRLLIESTLTRKTPTSAPPFRNPENTQKWHFGTFPVSHTANLSISQMTPKWPKIDPKMAKNRYFGPPQSDQIYDISRPPFLSSSMFPINAYKYGAKAVYPPGLFQCYFCLPSVVFLYISIYNITINHLQFN